MEDEILEEKFRQMTMHLERIESDYEMLNMQIRGLEVKIERVQDELTVPSGKMNQQFSKLEKQIQQLGAKSSS